LFIALSLGAWLPQHIAIYRKVKRRKLRKGARIPWKSNFATAFIIAIMVIKFI
jgi:hypothetical protein